MTETDSGYAQQFSYMDLDPKVRQSLNNADFADIMLEKTEFIRSLPEEVQPIARLVEKNIALGNFSELDTYRLRHKIDDIINTFMMQFPPGYHSHYLQYNLEKIKAVAEWEGTRAKGGTERRLLATQLSESTINQNSVREGQTSWFSRLSNAFKR